LRFMLRFMMILSGGSFKRTCGQQGPVRLRAHCELGPGGEAV